MFQYVGLLVVRESIGIVGFLLNKKIFTFHDY